ncbi:MAG: hypothetical protein WCP21_21895 [Armatimonadota bacterium]
MAEERCAKCGEELKAGALSCWACGTLTAAGRKAKNLPPDEEELWKRSVEAAKVRHNEKPAIDPEEALRQVIAQTGTEDQVQRAARPAGYDEGRGAYTKLRDSASSLPTIGLLVSVLFALVGLLIVALALMVLPTGAAAVLSIAGLVLGIAGATTVHFVFRHLADVMVATSDAADHARRAVSLLREQQATQLKEEKPQ